MRLIEGYKFCPRCGGNLKRAGDHLVCAKCGKDLYLNPKACTSVILLNEKNEILLVERGVEPKKGYWDLPGGFVDEGEDFEASAIRETKEELGIGINDLSYVGSFIEPYEFQGLDYNTVTICYKAKLPEGSRLKPADDVASYRLFKLDELPLDKLAFPSIKQILDKLI